MDLVLTGSRLEDGTSSGIDHPVGFTDTSKLTSVVYIVEPDETERKSLERLILCEGLHAETFASAEEFLGHPVSLVPSCLLLDVSLPGLSGLELQKRTVAEHPHIAIIFLSGKGNIPIAVEAIKAGAVEFLMKPFLSKRLLNVFREALDRSSKSLAREEEKRALRRCYASLSCRQQQVMALISSGLLNKQVGVELGISEITVKAHRGQVMHKMEADSFSALIKMAAKLGLSKTKEFPRKELPRLRRDASAIDLPGVPLDSYRAGML
jgi:FixJ family two-component response regulator